MNMFGKYSRKGKKLLVNCPAIIIKTDGTGRKCFNGNHNQIITACRINVNWYKTTMNKKLLKIGLTVKLS